MNELIPQQHVQDRVYRIRGKQVMLDSDLAALYGVPTERVNEQVRRNIRRFPPDFMFQLTHDELVSLRSQIAISKKGKGGRRYAPFVFTEQGVAMLSSVLRSEKAIEVNIAIMRAFVKLRRVLIASRDVFRRVEKLEGKVNVHDTDIRLLQGDVRDLHRKAGPPPTFKVKGFDSYKKP